MCTSTYRLARPSANGQDQLAPIVCTGSGPFVNGLPTPHLGKHRATIARGVRIRWTDAEAVR